MDRKILSKSASVILILAFCCCSGCSKTFPEKKLADIEHFLKTVVIDTLEEDYKRHNIYIKVVVTNLTIDRITRKDIYEYLSYSAQGRVSYIIEGRREWRDKEGNIIRLGPEEEITHWFSCGVLEDRYGELLKDAKNRFTFYADAPLESATGIEKYLFAANFAKLISGCFFFSDT